MLKYYTFMFLPRDRPTNKQDSWEINPFSFQVNTGDLQAVWTFESVDVILLCDHSNETSLAVLSHGPNSFPAF